MRARGKAWGRETLALCAPVITDHRGGLSARSMRGPRSKVKPTAAGQPPSGASAMQAKATLAAVGTPKRAVWRAGNPPGKCRTYSALISR